MIRAVLFLTAVASSSASAQTILVRDVEDEYDFSGGEPVTTEVPLTTTASFAAESALDALSIKEGSRFHAFVARVDIAVPYTPSMIDVKEVRPSKTVPTPPPVLTAVQTLPAIVAGIHHDRFGTAPGDRARLSLEEARITSAPNQPRWPAPSSGRFQRRRSG